MRRCSSSEEDEEENRGWGKSSNSRSVGKTADDPETLHFLPGGGSPASPDPDNVNVGRSDGGGDVSLREWLDRERRCLDLPECLHIFKQIVEMICAAHDQGVVVQSIRPSCFIISTFNRVSFIESASCSTSAGSGSDAYCDSPVRMHGEYSGTFTPPSDEGIFPLKRILVMEFDWYISPEESSTESPATLASDIYRLGVLLFELLCTSSSLEEKLQTMSNLRHRVLPSQLLLACPKEASFCLWLLHPQPFSRPKIREVLESEFLNHLHQHDTAVKFREEIEQQQLLLEFLLPLHKKTKDSAETLHTTISCLSDDIEEVLKKHPSTAMADFVSIDDDATVRSKSVRMMRNFSKMESAYFAARIRSSSDLFDGGEWMDPFLDGLCKYLSFSELNVRADLKQADLLSSSSLVCSLGFDRDRKLLATAGVNKKIKIFECESIVDSDSDVHYPVAEMRGASKFSNLCWNGYVKTQIASSDFDGLVQVWDVTRSQVFADMREHQKRVWAVDFSKSDPTKLASGSDDGTVKLWNINQAGSIGTIKTTANICSVQFPPGTGCTLAVGSADHNVYCYDLRSLQYMIGRAKTGTGKTLAFGIPIMDKIIKFNAKHGRGRNPLALVLAPTRELARQVEKEFRDSSDLDTLCVYGGSPINQQMSTLDYGVDVVVGTPGRVIDLIKRGALNLSEVQFLVLDEADQMLAVGFAEDVEVILEKLPRKRQSMMFSATMPSWIKQLTRKHLNDPLTIDLVGDSDQKLAEGISLFSICSDNYGKPSIIGSLVTEYAKGGKCIVFTQTKRDADRLAYSLGRSLNCQPLHGDISQAQRERTLSGFRDARFNVLVATDVAARGLDVPNVDLVIHYELPNSSEIFVHRTGRTGRAGKKGIAILIHSEHQMRDVKTIEQHVGCRFKELPKIKVESGPGNDMFGDMGGAGRFGSYDGSRSSRFGSYGGSSSGRSGGFGGSSGGYGSRSGGSGYGNSGFGGWSGGSGYGGSGSGGRSGGSNRSGGFGDSGRSDGGFGESRRSGGGFGDPGRSRGGFGDSKKWHSTPTTSTTNSQ